jgi:hypothetical protein
MVPRVRRFVAEAATVALHVEVGEPSTPQGRHAHACVLFILFEDKLRRLYSPGTRGLVG